MAIVSSVVLEDLAQIDGRRWILERHTDELGVLHYVQYLALAGANAQAVATARAAGIYQAIIDGEIRSNVSDIISNGSLATPTLQYSTLAQNAAALREAYRSATELQAVMMGDYLSGRTDGQLQTAFGLSAGQVTTLRANKLTPAASTAAEIRASAGQ